MRKVPIAPLAAAVLILAGCGSANNASTEASADTVEMPADEALAPVAAEPVADPNATATDAPEGAATGASPAPTATAAEQSAEAAANVAAEASAAAEAAQPSR